MTTAELSNVDVVVYVVFKLGGIEKKIHTEHIAMECFRLCKERFRWRLHEYRNYPDKQHVREALKGAVYFKDGAIITGRAGVEASGKETDGWMLTPKGAKWIIKNYRRIEKALKIETTAAKRPDIQRILRKFKQEKCYQRFLQYGALKDMSEYDFKDMLNCGPDAYPETIRKEFNRLKTQGEITQNKSILSFLEACKKAFGHLMLSRNDQK